jgi:hypothetical protein
MTPTATSILPDEPAALPRGRVTSERLATRRARPALLPWINAEDRPLVMLLVFFPVLFLVYQVAGIAGSDGLLALVNWAGPVALAGACAWAACRVVIGRPLALWAPLPWFLAAAAAYFGIGPLIYYLGNEETVAYIDMLWPVGPDDLWRTNVLNAVGLLCTVAGYLVGSRLLAKLAAGLPAGGTPWRQASARGAALLFLAVGLPVHFFLALPYEWGMFDFVLPNMVYSLAELIFLGLLLLSYIAARDRGWWRTGFWALFATELVVQFLCFNKTHLLLVLVMSALGRFMATRRVDRLVLAVAGTFLFYAFLAPVVTWCREAIAHEEGDQARATLAQRWRIAGEGAERWAEGTLDLGRKQEWLARLSYVNAEAFVLHRHDAGYPGETYGTVFYVFVPRFLDPDKPVMTDVGIDFTELTCGHRHSSTAIGIYGEAYWNGGWPLVVVISALTGLLFAWLSDVALARLARPEWLFLPCAFLGIKMGFRIDGWFVPDYVGSLAQYLAYYAAVRLLYAGR